jgi:hypothetical protein
MVGIDGLILSSFFVRCFIRLDNVRCTVYYYFKLLSHGMGLYYTLRVHDGRL